MKSKDLSFFDPRAINGNQKTLVSVRGMRVDEATGVITVEKTDNTEVVLPTTTPKKPSDITGFSVDESGNLIIHFTHDPDLNAGRVIRHETFTGLAGEGVGIYDTHENKYVNVYTDDPHLSIDPTADHFSLNLTRESEAIGFPENSTTLTRLTVMEHKVPKTGDVWVGGKVEPGVWTRVPLEIGKINYLHLQNKTLPAGAYYVAFRGVVYSLPRFQARIVDAQGNVLLTSQHGFCYDAARGFQSSCNVVINGYFSLPTASEIFIEVKGDGTYTSSDWNLGYVAAGAPNDQQVLAYMHLFKVSDVPLTVENAFSEQTDALSKIGRTLQARSLGAPVLEEMYPYTENMNSSSIIAKVHDDVVFFLPAQGHAIRYYDTRSELCGIVKTPIAITKTYMGGGMVDNKMYLIFWESGVMKIDVFTINTTDFTSTVTTIASTIPAMTGYSSAQLLWAEPNADKTALYIVPFNYAHKPIKLTLADNTFTEVGTSFTCSNFVGLKDNKLYYGYGASTCQVFDMTTETVESLGFTQPTGGDLSGRVSMSYDKTKLWIGTTYAGYKYQYMDMADGTMHAANFSTSTRYGSYFIQTSADEGLIFYGDERAYTSVARVDLVSGKVYTAEAVSGVVSGIVEHRGMIYCNPCRVPTVVGTGTVIVKKGGVLGHFKFPYGTPECSETDYSLPTEKGFIKAGARKVYHCDVSTGEMRQLDLPVAPVDGTALTDNGDGRFYYRHDAETGVPYIAVPPAMGVRRRMTKREDKERAVPILTPENLQGFTIEGIGGQAIKLFDGDENTNIIEGTPSAQQQYYTFSTETHADRWEITNNVLVHGCFIPAVAGGTGFEIYAPYKNNCNDMRVVYANYNCKLDRGKYIPFNAELFARLFWIRPVVNGRIGPHVNGSFLWSGKLFNSQSTIPSITGQSDDFKTEGSSNNWQSKVYGPIYDYHEYWTSAETDPAANPWWQLTLTTPVFVTAISLTVSEWSNGNNGEFVVEAYGREAGTSDLKLIGSCVINQWTNALPIETGTYDQFKLVFKNDTGGEHRNVTLNYVWFLGCKNNPGHDIVMHHPDGIDVSKVDMHDATYNLVSARVSCSDDGVTYTPVEVGYKLGDTLGTCRFSLEEQLVRKMKSSFVNLPAVANDFVTVTGTLHTGSPTHRLYEDISTYTGLADDVKWTSLSVYPCAGGYAKVGVKFSRSTPMRAVRIHAINHGTETFAPKRVAVQGRDNPDGKWHLVGMGYMDKLSTLGASQEIYFGEGRNFMEYRLVVLDIHQQPSTEAHAVMARVEWISGFPDIATKATVTSDSEVVGSEGTKVNDGTPMATEWVSSALPASVTLKHTRREKIIGYSVMNGTANAPTDWVLQGRNADSDPWTDLHSVVGSTTTGVHEDQNFIEIGEWDYSQYRLQFTKAGASAVHVAQVRLFSASTAVTKPYWKIDNIQSIRNATGLSIGPVDVIRSVYQGEFYDVLAYPSYSDTDSRCIVRYEGVVCNVMKDSNASSYLVKGTEDATRVPFHITLRDEVMVTGVELTNLTGSANPLRSMKLEGYDAVNDAWVPLATTRHVDVGGSTGVVTTAKLKTRFLRLQSAGEGTSNIIQCMLYTNEVYDNKSWEGRQVTMDTVIPASPIALQLDHETSKLYCMYANKAPHVVDLAADAEVVASTMSGLFPASYNFEGKLRGGNMIYQTAKGYCIFSPAHDAAAATLPIDGSAVANTVTVHGFGDNVIFGNGTDIVSIDAQNGYVSSCHLPEALSCRRPVLCADGCHYFSIHSGLIKYDSLEQSYQVVKVPFTTQWTKIITLAGDEYGNLYMYDNYGEIHKYDFGASEKIPTVLR